MQDSTLLSLINARADEHSIRDILKNIKITGGLQKGIIYFVIFEDLNAVSRRVYNQVNSITKELDIPVSISHVSKDNFNLEGVSKEQVSRMDETTQTTIFICCAGQGSFAPIISGVFDVL